ncbi:MAG TPA: outer membrane beta-barrel protein [Terracidiphilus sp.]|nr:outer membrane beta-barrel protein [Terracidiphilus sp.]
MKRIAFFVCLLAVSVAAARAQESRQDFSLSGSGLIEPYKGSSTDIQVHSTTAYGGLASYRFMLTPTSAVEVNYGITYENKITYFGPSFPQGITVLTRTQDISGAYVRSFVFKNWNPFVEAGPAAIIFMPILNSGTKTLDAHRQTAVGAMYGAGFAYEVSPSFDVRVEYRALVTKVPTFGVGTSSYNFTTNEWWNMSEPLIGVAYHF